jgi:hypothetical protein
MKLIGYIIATLLIICSVVYMAMLIKLGKTHAQWILGILQILTMIGHAALIITLCVKRK